MDSAIFDVKDAASFYHAIKLNKLVGFPEDQEVIAELEAAYQSHIKALKLTDSKTLKYLFFRGCLVGSMLAAKIVQHRLFVVQEEKNRQDKIASNS